MLCEWHPATTFHGWKAAPARISFRNENCRGGDYFLDFQRKFHYTRIRVKGLSIHSTTTSGKVKGGLLLNFYPAGGRGLSKKILQNLPEAGRLRRTDCSGAL